MISSFERDVTRHLGVSVSLVFALALSGCAAATTRAETTPAQAPATEANPAALASPAAAAGNAAQAQALFATSADGTRIAYDKTGTGPVLLLVHGGGQTRATWKASGYVDRLSKTFTVVAMDRRGSGDSGKPTAAEAYALDRVLEDMLAVADAAGAERFHVWGFGHGATIARYLAAQSDRVISAVLVGATMGPSVRGIVKDAITGMRARWAPILEAQAAGTLDLKTLSPGDREALNGGAAVSSLALGALVDYPPLEPAEIKAPTLWVIGSADQNAMENVKEYEGKLEGTQVTLKLIGGASYSDSFARLEPAMAEIEPFLTRQAAPPS